PRRSLGKLRQLWVEIIPRLRTVRVDIYRRPVTAWIIQTARHNTQQIRHNRRLAKQPGATGGTKRTAQNVTTVTLNVVVFHLASDVHGIPRHEEHRDIRPTSRPLAITAVTIGGHHWFS